MERKKNMAFIQCSFMSKVLNLKTNMNVILPHDGKCDKSVKPAVLYLLHGITDDHTVWSRYSSIERYVRDKNIAVIMPTVYNGFYTDTKIGYNYLKFCAEEVVDLCADMFGLSKEREDTFVAGLSMGGYGAFRLALEYPEKYCFAASMSGALDIVSICDTRRDNADINDPTVRDIINDFGIEGAKRGSRQDLFFLADEVSKTDTKPVLRQYCGTEDFLYVPNQNMKKHIEGLGFDYAYSEKSGAHTWDYWDSVIHEVILEMEKMCPKIKG